MAIGTFVVAAMLLLSVLIAQGFRGQLQLTRQKNDLVATVSDELKTPLTSMRALVDTLLETERFDEATTREYLQLVAQENTRLSRLIDLMLPKLNGSELCRAVRAEGRDVPIIMLTAKGQEEDIVRGLELGADDYVTKPFSIREVLARVQAFLRRHRSGAATVYEFGACRLDTVAHRLLRSDEEVPLTAKEYRLLEHLLQRRGRALTRDSIMQAVWAAKSSSPPAASIAASPPSARKSSPIRSSRSSSKRSGTSATALQANDLACG